MKAKLKGKITSINILGVALDKPFVKIEVSFDGVVMDTPISAKDTHLTGTLLLKKVVADKLKLGSIFTMTLSDEEQSE